MKKLRQEIMGASKIKCEICGRKLNKKRDYYELCAKCQIPWRKGWVAGQQLMKAHIMKALYEAEK